MFWRREAREEARSTAGAVEKASAPAAGDALLRRRYRYVGQVQGVGFRWTSSQVANGLGLAGWVRNEPDGSVTLVLQGTQDQLGAFATRLAQAMARYAHYAVTDREDEPVVAGDHEFKVRY